MNKLTLISFHILSIFICNLFAYEYPIIQNGETYKIEVLDVFIKRSASNLMFVTQLDKANEVLKSKLKLNGLLSYQFTIDRFNNIKKVTILKNELLRIDVDDLSFYEDSFKQILRVQEIKNPSANDLVIENQIIFNDKMTIISRPNENHYDLNKSLISRNNVLETDTRTDENNEDIRTITRSPSDLKLSDFLLMFGGKLGNATISLLPNWPSSHKFGFEAGPSLTIQYKRFWGLSSEATWYISWGNTSLSFNTLINSRNSVIVLGNFTLRPYMVITSDKLNWSVGIAVGQFLWRESIGDSLDYLTYFQKSVSVEPYARIELKPKQQPFQLGIEFGYRSGVSKAVKYNPGVPINKDDREMILLSGIRASAMIRIQFPNPKED